jgi:Uncharacterized protein conserved in bacteria (DUF2188)
MPDIVVRRHGDRWAVFEAGAESATKEFETRAAAETAARDLAAGGAVEVREDDTSGLGPDTSGEVGADEAGGPRSVSARERARSPQSGL